MAGYRARAVFLAASFIAAAAAHAGTYKWTGLGADADLQTGATGMFRGSPQTRGIRYVVFNNASAARLTANNRTADFVVQNLSFARGQRQLQHHRKCHRPRRLCRPVGRD